MSQRIPRVHVQKLALPYHGKVHGQGLCGISEGLCRVFSQSGQWWWALAHVSWTQVALSWSSDSWNKKNVVHPLLPHKISMLDQYPKKINVQAVRCWIIRLGFEQYVGRSIHFPPEKHFSGAGAEGQRFCKTKSGIMSVPVLNCFFYQCNHLSSPRYSIEWSIFPLCLFCTLGLLLWAGMWPTQRRNQNHTV